MIRAIYKALLRGPNFRGRNRLESALRPLLLPSADVVADGLKMELDPRPCRPHRSSRNPDSREILHWPSRSHYRDLTYNSVKEN